MLKPHYFLVNCTFSGLSLSMKTDFYLIDTRKRCKSFRGRARLQFYSGGAVFVAIHFGTFSNSQDYRIAIYLGS